MCNLSQQGKAQYLLRSLLCYHASFPYYHVQFGAHKSEIRNPLLSAGRNAGKLVDGS